MTAEIVLSSGDIALVDDADAELVSDYKWNPRRCPRTTYAQTSLPRVNGKRSVLTMHRLITGAGPGETVDHDNWNGLDNQRHNLRVSGNRHGNNQNARLRRDNTSGYRGVAWHSRVNRWSAYIYVHDAKRHLGYFSTPGEAALAYDLAAYAFHGEYASVNGIAITRENVSWAADMITRYETGKLREFIRDPRIMRELLGGQR